MNFPSLLTLRAPPERTCRYQKFTFLGTLSVLDDLSLSLENLGTKSYGATSQMKPLRELLRGAATVETLVSGHPQDATLLELAINKTPEIQKTVC